VTSATVYTSRSASETTSDPLVGIPQPRTKGGQGSFGRVQLLAAEVAGGSVGLAVFSGSVPAMAAASGAALVLLGLTWLPFGGRWGYQTVAVRRALRSRRAAARRSGRQGQSPRGLRIRDHEDRGSRIGLGQDQGGWFVAIELGDEDELLSSGQTELRLDRVTRLLEESSARPSTMQVVRLRISAPSTVLPSTAPCVMSYQELLRSTGGTGSGDSGEPELAADLTWIAIRLEAQDALAAALERGGGLEGVAKALSAATSRICKLLTSAGVAHRVLDAAQLRQVVAMCCGFDPSAAAGTESAEAWNQWRTAEVAQRSFELCRWPGQTTDMSLDQLLCLPAAHLAVSVVLRPADSQLSVTTVVRVIDLPERIVQTCREVDRSASRSGFRLRPLLGLQEPAIYASAPTGGQFL
jgi:type VII secretion protein EccE